MGNNYSVINYNSVNHKSKSIIKNSSKINYEYIIFEGGGVKGLAYCGALQILEDKGILQNIKGYAGTSAGAITATLCAIGYNSNEITNIIKKIDFSKFLDNDMTGIFGDIYKLCKDYGEHSGNCFHKTMSSLIEDKTGNINYTFGNLWKDKKINLVIVATNLNNLKSMYFSYINYPDMPIADALRMSMSIPFLFYPVKFEDNIYIDGGLIDNYPLHVFDGDYPGDPKTSVDISDYNNKVLGLKLITPNEECNYQLYKPLKINSVKQFSYAILETLIAANERKYIKSNYWKRTLPIYITKNISSIDFNLTGCQKENLIKDGINSVNKWL
jgi:NTE family protein